MDISGFSIGFTQTTAARFFERLRSANVRKVVDVRLHNTSQLAGFAKSEDLAYFLREICGIEYVHEPLLAPTDSLLKAYKKEGGSWQDYNDKFLQLMSDRKIEDTLQPASLDRSCLLCSEATPHYCHRRLVWEYLRGKWGPNMMRIEHL